MAELKKYTSFEELKSDEKLFKPVRPKEKIFSEFEAFVKRLQNEYSRKKNTRAENAKQPNQ